MEQTDDAHSSAPRHEIPAIDLVGVEHPFVVKNPSRAIDSLGGVRSVARLVDRHDADTPARLSLHPHDPVAHTIASGIVAGNNVLLKIQVPAFTGRKRKRGSDEPFRSVAELAALGKDESGKLTSSEPPEFIKALRDNPEKCQISVVGRITHTHRFRDPPDFAWSHPPNGFVPRFKTAVLSGSYTKIRDFRLESPSDPDHELLPPPSLLPGITPWNYMYRQNVNGKTVEQDGKPTVHNSAVNRKLRIAGIRASEPDIPNPDPRLVAETYERMTAHDKKIVANIRALFDERPIWTRRSITNRLRAQGIKLVQIEQHCYAQLAYSFLSGPWRDTLVKYGVDPRKDPAMRIYQTLAFRTDDMGRLGSKVRKGPREYGSSIKTTGPSSTALEDAIRTTPDKSHIFDGRRVDVAGKLWQLCDIIDPLVQDLTATDTVRSSCDMDSSGWYYNGSWGKLRAIIKLKIKHLVESGQPLADNHANVQLLLRVPDHITQASYRDLIDKRIRWVGPKEKTNLEALRTAMRVMIKREKVSDLSPGPSDERLPMVDGERMDEDSATEGDGAADREEAGEEHELNEAEREANAERQELLDDLEFDDDQVGEEDNEDEDEADEEEENGGVEGQKFP